jgi:hypothetical protein
MIGPLGMTDRHVTEGINYIVVGKDTVGGYEIVFPLAQIGHAVLLSMHPHGSKTAPIFSNRIRGCHDAFIDRWRLRGGAAAAMMGRWSSTSEDSTQAITSD